MNYDNFWNIAARVACISFGMILCYEGGKDQNYALGLWGFFFIFIGCKPKFSRR